jgi:hypothetical protein
LGREGLSGGLHILQERRMVPVHAAVVVEATHGETEEGGGQAELS